MGFLGQLAAESELIAVTGFVGGTQLGKPTLVNSAGFFNIVQRGGGIKPMFKNFVANILLF